MAVVRPSVCLSVYPVPDPIWLSKLKIRSTETHDTGDPWPHLEVKRSKVKVIRPLNAVTENQPYLWSGKTCNHLQGAGTQRLHCRPHRSDVKCQYERCCIARIVNALWHVCVLRCLLDKEITNCKLQLAYFVTDVGF